MEAQKRVCIKVKFPGWNLCHSWNTAAQALLTAPCPYPSLRKGAPWRWQRGTFVQPGLPLPTLRCAGKGWAVRATVVLRAGYFLVKERSPASKTGFYLLLQDSLLSLSKVCWAWRSKGKGEGFVSINSGSSALRQCFLSHQYNSFGRSFQLEVLSGSHAQPWRNALAGREEIQQIARRSSPLIPGCCLITEI